MGNHSETAELLEEALNSIPISKKTINPAILKDDEGNTINIGDVPADVSE